MAGTDVITHVKSMILPTGITYAITLIFFGVLGVMQYHGGDADMSRVIEFSNALNAAEGGVFNINPLLAPASGRRYRGSCPEGSRDSRHHPRHCCRCHPGPHLPARCLHARNHLRLW